MALLDLNHGAEGRGIARTGQAGTSLLRSIISFFERRALYSRTIRELNALSDRELNDLGIHRMDIRRIASEAL